ncbi:nitroreductase family protein [Aerococcaceae bacterium DSM 111022]|nr:nitroreductase family protein [Aerococcaceae bacterium DSM 111022]
MSTFLELVKNRRTQYAIGNNTELTNEAIAERITEIVRDVPTASNSQTTRIAIIFGEENVKLWDHILDVQKDVLQGEMWDMMSGVMEGAKGGVGTVLFFEDLDAVEAMPTSPSRVEVYKQNNNANAQYAVWLGLTDLGLGGSLQHMNVGYEQGFDKSVKELLGLPERWELQAQMPFGSIEGENAPKEYIADSDRVVVLGN